MAKIGEKLWKIYKKARSAGLLDTGKCTIKYLLKRCPGPEALL